jgi:hypothetical protein
LEQFTNVNIKPLTGKGAFFYTEPITIGDNNTALDKPPEPLMRKILMTCDIQNGDRVMVTDDGFICLFNDNDEQVIKILNTVFASARLFWGVSLDILRIGELCNFEWIPNSGFIRIVGYAFVERNIFSLQRDKNNETFEEWKNKLRKLVRRDEMIQIIKFAYWILQNNDLHMDLILLFDGYTLYHRGAFTASYLYGWMMIETFLSKTWKEYIESLDRPKADKDALSNYNSWTTYNQIEILSAVNKMEPRDRDVLNQLRQKRNSIVHYRKDVDYKNAYYCLNVADKILQNRINTPNTPFIDINKIRP